MKRIAVASALIAYVLGVGVITAVSHPTSSFDACVRHGADRCRNSSVVIARDAVYVMAHHIRPTHAGDVARLWRLEPRADAWSPVAHVRVRPEGRLKWRWETSDEDIHNFTSWRFRYVLPGHGHSDTVKVRVITPDF